MYRERALPRPPCLPPVKPNRQSPLSAVDLTIHGAHTRTGWIWQACLGDPSIEANWKDIGRTTASSFQATGLISGTKYWFRAAYVVSGQNQQSPWSDPASRTAP